MSVSHPNGRISVYTRRPTVLKQKVGRRQTNNLLGAGVRSQSGAAGERGTKRLPPRPTSAEQVGLLASIGLSDIKFIPIRLLFGGVPSPMAIRPVFRAARAALTALPANEVSLLDTGTHLAHLSQAVEGRLAQL